MNIDDDIYCICDVGMFPSEDCPACNLPSIRTSFDPNRVVEKEKPRLHITDLALHYEKLRKESKP